MIGCRKDRRFDLEAHLELKDFVDYIRLVDEADDPHFPLALGAGKRICFIDFSDEVRPALFYFF